ncbi:MAG: hypothetical protein DMG61_03890, partial [Acidobacteria bacterium]
DACHVLCAKRNQHAFLVWDVHARGTYRVTLLICDVVHCGSISSRSTQINITKGDRGFVFGR